MIIKVPFRFPKFASACKNQLISWIILEIQQILQSHELKGHTHSDHDHPKIIKATFSFPEFVSTHQKSVHSIDSFLKYSQF